jgi:hypothetical protein
LSVALAGIMMIAVFVVSGILLMTTMFATSFTQGDALKEAPEERGAPMVREMAAEIEDIDPVDLLSEIVSLTDDVGSWSKTG